MNCQTFSDLASDIARDQIMDAAVRAKALAHADGCLNCAARLRAQQRLTSDLHELCSAAEDQTASLEVWEYLSNAFDARTITHLRTTRRRRISVAGAIAATLLLSFGAVTLLRHRQPAFAQVSIAASFSSAPASQTTNEGSERDIIGSVSRKPHTNPRRHPLNRDALTAQINQPKEVATDFILLTDREVGADAQMVRLELPRAAMANFGLPVNVDRADERVKADVVLGADGLARAIRFVQ